ncbi:MAG TPA: glutamate-5-semialdehyde dehydrogenase [Bacteroidales bacterium]|nr:glutamate-5-semialdehyde dehydrogenase [Bacteroidales bacterium]
MKYQNLFENVKVAGQEMSKVSCEVVYDLLTELADEIIRQIPFLIAENSRDLALMDPADPKYDRLLLNESRLEAISADMLKVASLPSPLGKVTEERFMPNGLFISKITVPFGVVGVVYEARPNVTFDVFSLCIKSGNACILKGGSDARYSNEASVSIIKKVLKSFSLSPSTCELMPSDRESTHEMLNARGYIDVIIPRGSKQLIDYVAENSRMPVIETGAGIVHTYLDETADIMQATAVISNAKTRRVSVCNALDCLIVNSQQLNNLSGILMPLSEKNVVIYADEPSYAALNGKYPGNLLETATDESFGTEFLSYKMAVKTVNNLNEALEHIRMFSSKHSEAILSTDKASIDRFINEVDAAAVYANTSTAFTDGGQFGLGAEVGISTQKLHARGPMGVAELTSYKWIIKGNGQIRQ